MNAHNKQCRESGRKWWQDSDEAKSTQRAVRGKDRPQASGQGSDCIASEYRDSVVTCVYGGRRERCMEGEGGEV